MRLIDKKVAILAAPGFEDSELIGPLETLKNNGAQTTIIGLGEDDKRGIRGKRGAVVPADATIDEVLAGDFDALVIPGGKSPRHLRRDQRVLDFVRSFDHDRKPIAAICHGPQVLVSAGVLKGRTATGYFTVSREIKKAGAEFVDKPVVRDGNIITSRKPADIPGFVAAVLDSLDGGDKKSA